MTGTLTIMPPADLRITYGFKGFLREDAKMERLIGTKSASPGLAKGLVRAAAVAFMVVSFGVSSIGLSGLGLLGVSGLAITVAAPAQARCLLGGQIRNDIPDGDCLEAQRTGCVRSKLTESQYTNCLAANRNKQASCIIKGQVRDDLSREDCEEAKATGCVRRLLSATQYKSCLDAQPVKR